MIRKLTPFYIENFIIFNTPDNSITRLIAFETNFEGLHVKSRLVQTSLPLTLGRETKGCILRIFPREIIRIRFQNEREFPLSEWKLNFLFVTNLFEKGGCYFEGSNKIWDSAKLAEIKHT